MTDFLTHAISLCLSVHSSCSDSSSVGSQKEGGSPASGRDPRRSSGSTSYSQVASTLHNLLHENICGSVQRVIMVKYSFEMWGMWGDEGSFSIETTGFFPIAQCLPGIFFKDFARLSQEVPDRTVWQDGVCNETSPDTVNKHSFFSIQALVTTGISSVIMSSQRIHYYMNVEHYAVLVFGTLILSLNKNKCLYDANITTNLLTSEKILTGVFRYHNLYSQVVALVLTWGERHQCQQIQKRSRTNTE